MGTVSDTTEYWWGGSYDRHPNRPPDYTKKKNAKQKAKNRKISKMKALHPELSRKQIQEILREQSKPTQNE